MSCVLCWNSRWMWKIQCRWPFVGWIINANLCCSDVLFDILYLKLLSCEIKETLKAEKLMKFFLPFRFSCKIIWNARFLVKIAMELHIFPLIFKFYVSGPLLIANSSENWTLSKFHWKLSIVQYWSTHIKFCSEKIHSKLPKAPRKSSQTKGFQSLNLFFSSIFFPL